MTYAAILADPPWKFKVWSDRTGRGRSADAHYDTMTVEEIAALPVRDLAARDCVLFMWVTEPFLFMARDVILAWGFEYKTIAFVWAKLNRDSGPVVSWDENWFMGTGRWTRANPEPCLLATRGHPKRIGKNVRELIVAPRREHSRKPDETYARIERLVAGPYVELFARSRREGWDVAFSNEAASGPGRRRWAANARVCE